MYILWLCTRFSPFFGKLTKELTYFLFNLRFCCCGTLELNFILITDFYQIFTQLVETYSYHTEKVICQMSHFNTTPSTSSIYNRREYMISDSCFPLLMGKVRLPDISYMYLIVAYWASGMKAFLQSLGESRLF